MDNDRQEEVPDGEVGEMGDRTRASSKRKKRSKSFNNDDDF